MNFQLGNFFLSCSRDSNFNKDRKHLRSILNDLNNARSLKELEKSLQKVKSERLSPGVLGKINELEEVVKDQKVKINNQIIELEKLKVEIKKNSIDDGNFMNHMDDEIKNICKQLLKCDLSHDLKESIRKLNKQRQASYDSYFKGEGSKKDKLLIRIKTVLKKIKVKEGIKSLTSNSNSFPEPPRFGLNPELLPPPAPPPPSA